MQLGGSLRCNYPTDNGIGFDDTNLESFCTSDSTYKQSRGGKGVGKFSWLKFFESVSVRSMFSDSGKSFKREFKFTHSGIDDDAKSETETQDNRTTVELKGMYTKFSEKCPRKLDTISEKLVEHFLSYFATQSCPDISLRDGAESISLKRIYSDQFGNSANKHTISVKGESFEVVGLKLNKGNQVHKIHLCGHKRVSESLSLSNYDSILERKLEDEGRSFAYRVYVEGEYLDGIVNEDREGFQFPDDRDEIEDMERKITKSELIDGRTFFVNL